VFLEVHQPVGHLEVRHVEQLPALAESRHIFAMGVDHHDMAFGRHVADAMEDQRGGGRLAGAGRAEQREMLAQQRIDIEPGADVARREDGAHGHVVAPVTRIDLAQVGAGGRIGERAGHRIAGHTAPKARDTPGFRVFLALAQKVHLGQRARFDLAVTPLVAHRAEQPAPVAVGSHAQLDLAADLPRHGHGRVFVGAAFLQPVQIECDQPARTRHVDNHADGLQRAGRRRRIAGNFGLFAAPWMTIQGSHREPPSAVVPSTERSPHASCTGTCEILSTGWARSMDMKTCLLVSLIPLRALVLQSARLRDQG
jgi:hypothetical protein